MSRLAKDVFRCAVAAMFLSATAYAGTPKKPAKPLDAWSLAVAARQAFELEPEGTHTKPEYAHVIGAFRGIYHSNPADAHAAAAVEQVAELLAEQGHELNDAKSLKDAAAQYEFLSREYPGSPAARTAVAKTKQLVAADRTVVAKVPLAPTREATHLQRVEDTASRTASTAKVTAIRHWSTPTYTRVAIDLGGEVQYEAARVEHPDRLFFDLHHAKLAPELVGKSFAVTDDGFLTRIRAAQNSDDTTRVVLDVHEVTDYSAFLLPNPYRLIIDIHGKTAGAEPVASAAKTPPKPHTVAQPKIIMKEGPAETPPPEKFPVDDGGAIEANVSRLPPMPVTDGSAGFGLPAKTNATTKTAVAPPRVVIPVKPTVAKPVPNTVASKSESNGSDVAAVSDQPGKVEATDRPTNKPVSAKSATLSRGRVKPETAAPAIAPSPTADGETSLMRALGLKIGRIVIDAGHGGHDSGTLGVDGIQEKDVVLDVALRVGKLLHQRMGAEIVYTRADDTFIPLETRTAIANKAQADLFISIHANSSQEPSARGVEVYYLNFTSDAEAMKVAGRENAVSTKSVHELSELVKKIALKDKIEESHELASDVEASLFAGLRTGNEGLKDRGVKKAPFVVLIGANMPSILAEISFVTNPDDAVQLRTPEYRQRVAESLYNGVARYAEGINGTKAQPVRTKIAAMKTGR